ncbi:MAG: hypothetical protein FWD64_11760 [Acidobacteriaceae bacterium]|nr:hypothetical protein [Acidobacteriaceae bacterium]
MAQAKTATAPAHSAKNSPRTLEGTAKKTDGRSHALSSYEAAVRLMQEGKFEKARLSFEKILGNGAGDFAERARMYIHACETQTARIQAAFQSNEERYDYAVSLLNEGNYEDAREQFSSILKQDGDADYAYYGLATLASMTGDVSGCLINLSEAIRRNPRNRIQARSDSDFQDMADDPRFTELLYPEA